MKMTWTWTGEEATIDDLVECAGPGWRKHVEQMVADLEALGWSGKVTQVKEKFGGMRFYYEYEGIPDNLQRVAMAVEIFHEGQSTMTCQLCGKHGTTRRKENSGWLATLCRTCAVERGYPLEKWEEPDMDSAVKAVKEDPAVP